MGRDKKRASLCQMERGLLGKCGFYGFKLNFAEFSDIFWNLSPCCQSPSGELLLFGGWDQDSWDVHKPAGSLPDSYVHQQVDMPGRWVSKKTLSTELKIPGHLADMTQTSRTRYRPVGRVERKLHHGCGVLAGKTPA